MIEDDSILELEESFTVSLDTPTMPSGVTFVVSTTVVTINDDGMH